MKRLRTKLLSLISACAMMLTALPALPAAAADDLTQQNVFITYTGQVVDSFMGIDAVYSTYYSWSGYYSCAAYIDKFYHAFYDVNLYDINNYKGKPHVYYPISGHEAELREVSAPIPGDIMQDKEYSHVAIVKAVSGSQVTLIEQNWKWDDWATGDLVCTINRKVNIKDNYFYRLYIDGQAKTLSKTVPTLSSASASSITKDGFTVKASAKDDLGIDRFVVTTYPKSKGTSAAKTVTVSKSGTSASAEVKVKASDFGNVGDTYVTVVDVYNTSGEKASKTINTVVNRTAPVISGIKVTNKSSSGYTVSCTVDSQGTISSVKFPTWTSLNATDDLRSDWMKSTVCDGKVSGTTATFTVKTADHNKELGEYNTCIYAYDSFGNCSTKAVQVNLSKMVNDLEVDAISAKNYTGKALTPAVTVRDGDKVLTQDVDYTVSYSNNTKVGKASVRINGIGRYSGSKLVNFNIKPAKVKGMKVVKATTTSVQIKWNENENADGYYIYRKVDGSWVKVGSTSDLKYTVSGLSVGSNYEFSVIAHKKVAGINYNSRHPSTSLKGVTKTSQVVGVRASKNSGVINVSWTKLSKTDGYAVYVSNDGKNYTRYTCIDDPEAVSYQLKGQKGLVYVKIRGYKLIGNTHYYGAYSGPAFVFI